MRNGIGTSRFLIVASLVLPVVALAQPLAGDPASGRKTATALCGTCHQVIGGKGRDSPASGHRQHDLNHRSLLKSISSFKPQGNA